MLMMLYTISTHVTVIKCPEIRGYRDLLKRLEYAIFSTTENWSTRAITKRLYSGIFQVPLYTKNNIFKIQC